MEDLGKELRRVRRIKGLSLREVERGTGISNAYLSQLEGGKAKHPSPAKLKSLANFYSIPYESLLRSAGYLSSHTDGRPEALKIYGADPTRTLTAVGAALLAADFEPEEEQLILHYIEFIKEQRKKKEARDS